MDRNVTLQVNIAEIILMDRTVTQQVNTAEIIDNSNGQNCNTTGKYC